MTSANQKNHPNIRATCLNCIDGRVQRPVLNWIREQYHVDVVDVITAPGIDGLIASRRNIREILRSIEISLRVNKSTRIFIVAHHDCRGHPVDKKTHRQSIMKAINRLKTYWGELEITGLWVNRHWQVEAWDTEREI